MGTRIQQNYTGRKSAYMSKLKSEMETDAYRNLTILENSVLAWEINPGAYLEIEKAKKSYEKYNKIKQRITLPKEMLEKESNLVKRAGGILK